MNNEQYGAKNMRQYLIAFLAVLSSYSPIKQSIVRKSADQDDPYADSTAFYYPPNSFLKMLRAAERSAFTEGA